MSETANQTEQKTEFAWSDVDESPVIPTAVPTQEPPTVDLSASISNLKDVAKPLEPSAKPLEPSAKPLGEPLAKPLGEPSAKDVSTNTSEPQKLHVSAAEPTESKTTELNQEMIDALLNKLMEFDDMPPLVDDDEIPELVYSSDDSCPRCDAALKVLLSNRRHPVINVESDESEESEESVEPNTDSDVLSDSDDSTQSETSDPPTPRTLAYRQVNVPSAIQYITVILAILYLLKFYFFMNESRIRYRPCT